MQLLAVRIKFFQGSDFSNNFLELSLVASFSDSELLFCLREISLKLCDLLLRCKLLLFEAFNFVFILLFDCLLLVSQLGGLLCVFIQRVLLKQLQLILVLCHGDFQCRF